MSDPLPPFAISKLNEDEKFSVVQVDERQYQDSVERYPDAVLSYIDEDDGERVVVGSGLELKQRLDDPPKLTGPVNCYNLATEQFENRMLHLFDIQRRNLSHDTWRVHHEEYKMRSRQSEPLSKGKQKVESVSSICLNTNQANKAPKSDKLGMEQSQSLIDSPTSPNVDMTTLLSDAIPDLVENLANIMQATSDTLRKAAEKSRGSKTSPVEDVLSGMSSIVTEIGHFGLTLLGQLNDRSISSASENEPLPRDSVERSEISEVSADDVQQPYQASVEDLESSTKSSPSETKPQEPKADFRNIQQLSDDICEFCSTCRLQCRRSTESANACYNCDTLGHPCSLSSSSTPISNAEIDDYRHSPANDTVISKDGSILDQDTEDAEFSRRYPPLMSLRRANTVAGLHHQFESSSRPPNDQVLNRHNSWVQRYPHRPAPQILDEETRRRKDFARNCFPGQEYVPGPAVQEAKHVSHKRPVSLNFRTMDAEFQKRNTPSQKSSILDLLASQPFDSDRKKAVTESPPVGNAGPDVETADEGRASLLESSLKLDRVTLPGAWPESTEGRFSNNGPVGESSGAFFHRMMRDNPARKQKHDFDANERLTRHRSFVKPKSTNNPFSELNRSHTVSGNNNPASRLNRPFEPLYPEIPPISASTFTKRSHTHSREHPSRDEVSQPQVRFAERAQGLQRPFSPVWEHDVGQPKVHNKNDITAPFDRNGESSSMYSPPPRHMRSVPNLRQSNLPDFRHTQWVATNRSLDTADQPSTSSRPPRIPVPEPKSYTKPDPDSSFLRGCVRKLAKMGYGLDDENLRSRLHIYAKEANGNVAEAVAMIEEDKEANSRWFNSA